MTRFVAVVGLLTIIVGVCVAPPPPSHEDKHIKAFVELLGKKCANETTIDDFKIMMEGKKLDHPTKAQKCLTKCIMEQSRMINNGEFDSETFIMAVGTSDQKAKIKEIAETCKGLPNTDPCDYAYSVAICIEEMTKENDIEMEHF